ESNDSGSNGNDNTQESDPSESSTPETTPESSTPETTPESTPKFSCTPNDDGEITVKELPFVAGHSLRYQSYGSKTSPITVDLKGKFFNDKTKPNEWDFRTLKGTPTNVSKDILAYKGQWFEGIVKDPIPQFAQILNQKDPVTQETTVAAYNPTPFALQMLGWFSQTKEQVRVTYNQPVTFMLFPLKEGLKWINRPQATGTLDQKQTVLYKADESYRFEIDDSGVLKLPQKSYKVLRLRRDITVTQSLPTTQNRTWIEYHFISECHGIVAKVRSLPNATKLFTQAARVQLLLP
ncbi:MAG: hypothetical protein AAGJ35_16230, partial [Myxococcota bacterium]